MSRQTINSGSAPIIWSTVDEAFNKINDNFTELYLSIGGGGAVDLTAINSSISPGENETYDLGSPSKRWRDIYLSGSSIHLGSAVITSEYGAVKLPAGSTIGNLALDESYFKTIAVSGQSNIVADTGTDTLTFASSTGISLTTNATTDTLTIANSGVLTNVAGTGITVSGATGNVTISNAGVLSTIAGYGISVSGSTGNITIANTGIVSVITDPGSGISLDTSVPGTVRITNSAPSVPQNIFQTVAVSGQSNVVADSTSDTLTFVNGTGISITTNALSDSITFTNSGVTNIAVSGIGLSVSGATGSVSLSNTGVVAISAGDGISVNQSTGTVVITNSRYGFTSIAVSGQDSILADNATDTLVLVAGEGIQLTTNSTNDSISLDVTYVKGSVFSDTSTMVINGATGTVVGPVSTSSLRTSESAIALGNGAGYTNQDIQTVAIGNNAGAIDQGQRAVAVGSLAGSNNQGDYAVAIGNWAGGTNQPANSIVINASGSALNGSAAGFFVDPVRSNSTGSPLIYNTTTKELSYSSVLEFVGSTISTSDSSGIIIDVQTTFNTQVSVNGTLTVGDGITGYLSLAGLKSVVAASSSFADFQSRIAAL